MYVYQRPNFLENFKLNTDKVRDRHAAAALGRPVRIRDEDCDIEMLEEPDFEELEISGSGLFGILTTYHISYAISMAKLAIICMNSFPGVSSRI